MWEKVVIKKKGYVKYEIILSFILCCVKTKVSSLGWWKELKLLILAANIYGREMIVTDDEFNSEHNNLVRLDIQVEFFTKPLAK